MQSLAPSGHGRIRYYGGPTVDQASRTTFSTAETFTFNHPNFREMLGKGDVGGPFWSSKSYYSASGNDVQAEGLGRVYEGTLHSLSSYNPRQGLDIWPKPGNFDYLVGLGSTAVSRTVPTNPISGAAVAVGEAREGFPRLFGEALLKSRARDLRAIGDEYLNLEFGWKPLMSDLRKFSRSVKTSNKVLRQLHRDSGLDKVVRRRYQFPTDTSTSITSPRGNDTRTAFMCSGEPLDAWMNGDGPQQRGHEWSTFESTKTWFSGGYSYYVPDAPDTFLGRLDKWDAEANKLLGTRLTPSVVWELAPWSWAVDWFSNTGDVIHNISAFSNDNLLLNYGYIMQTHTMETVSSWQGYINTPTGKNQFVQTREAFGTETKVRLRATPFGFGIDFGALSPRQIAITSALAISRTPRLSL